MKRPLLLLLCAATACASGPDPALQQRGAAVMGVDQYTSTHVFDDLPDGGRITYRSDTGAADAVANIRAHLKQIADAFAKGDFSAPAAVHAREVPGTNVMRDRRAAIRYEYRDTTNGGSVTMRTTDAIAVQAIHEFLAFQRSDHHAGGMKHH